MTKQQIQDQLLTIFSTVEGNTITAEQAGSCPVAGLQLFQPPLVGFGSAADPMFESYKEDGVIGPWFMAPQEWLPGAKSIISFFFPFTQAVCDGEARSQPDGTSLEWLLGRIEGQQFLLSVLQGLCGWLTAQGAAVCMPAADPRFAGITGGQNKAGPPGDHLRYIQQQLVGAPRGLRLRPGHFQPDPGHYHPKGHRRPPGQHHHRPGAGARPQALHRPVRLLYPLRRLYPALSRPGHQPGGRQAPGPLQSAFRHAAGALRPPLWLRKVPDRDPLPIPHPRMSSPARF